MLTVLAKLLKALNSESRPAQVSIALVLGMLVGLTPLWSLHNLVVLFLICIIRINMSGFLVAWVIASGFAYFVDGYFIQVGEALLFNPEYKELFNQLYMSDLWRLTHFNNTLTLGSFCVAALVALPAFFIFQFLIVNYREHVLVWINKSKVMQMLKASKFYGLYMSTAALRGSI